MVVVRKQGVAVKNTCEINFHFDFVRVRICNVTMHRHLCHCDGRVVLEVTVVY